MPQERFPVEAAHILMFARAIGDDNPAYTDPTGPTAQALGGVLAPPTFAVASLQFEPDTHLRPKPGRAWFGSGATASGAAAPSGNRLHAEQHFEFRRPLVAGDVLVPVERPSASWTKQSRDGGTLQFEERHIDYLDETNGEVVVATRMVTAQRLITDRPGGADAR